MNSVNNSAQRPLRNGWYRAMIPLVLATGLETVGAQSADLFFEGVLLVEPAPPVEEILPATDRAAGSAQGAMGMGAAGNNAMGGGGQGGMGGGGADPAGPAPVQFFLPAQRRSEVALVMIPGGGLPSWSYTATPDGREGWAQQFARAGVPVYLLNPNLRGTIAVETTNCPTDEAALNTIYVEGGRAFLSLWGDNLDRGAPSMLTRYASCRQASETISAAGGRAQTIHLPEDSGIAGNSHLMMQDRNNTEIGGMILEWLRAEFGGSG